MEFVFEILFQLFLELIGAGLEHLYYKLRGTRTDKPSLSLNIGKPSRLLIIFLYLVGGGIVGWLSLYIMPEHLVKGEVYKILSLIISPLVAGYFMHLVAKRRTNYGKQLVSFENFYNGFSFAFGMSLIRFLFAA